MTNDDTKQAEAAARALGLERAFEVDPEGFTTAFVAARGYRERRPSGRPPADEPAHIFVAGRDE